MQYRDFNFAVVQTQHFEVHFDENIREAALEAAQRLERAYGRLSRLLNHQYRERQPVILFGSHSEFQQNNLTGIGEGVQGVTDPYRHRIILPFTDSREDFDHVLQHELVHQFQFDIFAGGHIGDGVGQLLAVQPPLWLMEGLAEYFSIGPVDPLTAMWLRDAALEGTLPTIQQLSTDPTIFPYRFGHALMAFIAERWGNATVADVLHGVASAGVAFGFESALGLTLDELSAEWHDAIQREYLPAIAAKRKAHDIGTPRITRERSEGRMHVGPALSPDGTQLAYFSESKDHSVDLYVSDIETDSRRRRLVKSAFSADFESVRFIESAGSWSPNGRSIAFPAQRGGRDDLVILDAPARRVVTRIPLPLAGIANPTWSPDGRSLVFTGLDAGFSNLYAVDADGTSFRQLTDDRHSALHPVWSPDGVRIAFATDRGEGIDPDNLVSGRFRIALLDMTTGRVELLAEMPGDNTNPQWSPDGGSLAFLSNRDGSANVFLYDLGDGESYQITNVYTGISGITATSPAISWARDADRLAFTYYEGGAYDIYTVDHPRRLRVDPYRAAPLIADASVTGATSAVSPTPGDAAAITRMVLPRRFGSFQRLGKNFSLAVPPASDSTPPTASPSISLRALLDSTSTALPDTASFTSGRYTPRLRTDYVIQPTVGYVRDNFGQGVYGGTAISMSDLLGNRRLVLGGQVNGRIEEAQLATVYSNQAHRTNWSVGYIQSPLFYFNQVDVSASPGTGHPVLNQRYLRFITHQAFVEARRPFNRFHRIEYRLALNSVSQAQLNFSTTYDQTGSFVVDQDVNKQGLGRDNYVQPSIALVYDNTTPGWIGPAIGRRTRLEYAPAIGDWSFHRMLADYRRYDRLVGPIVFASRALFFGRFGRDSDTFRLYLGMPDMLRGYTSGSFRRAECAIQAGTAPQCAALNSLVGSRVGVLNLELRFPLFRDLGFLPFRSPPFEGALFFDSGMAWNHGDRLAFSRRAADPVAVRVPRSSWGVSVRTNLYGLVVLRSDLTQPIDRNGHSAYWTVSLGPVF